MRGHDPLDPDRSWTLGYANLAAGLFGATGGGLWVGTLMRNRPTPDLPLGAITVAAGVGAAGTLLLISGKLMVEHGNDREPLLRAARLGAAAGVLGCVATAIPPFAYLAQLGRADARMLILASSLLIIPALLTWANLQVARGARLRPEPGDTSEPDDKQP